MGGQNTKRYRTTLVVDNTYKTNKFGMPLFDIAGFGLDNKTFLSGYALYSSSKQEDYEWYLTHLRKVFGEGSSGPKVIACDRDSAIVKAIKVVFLETEILLCMWYVEKGITTICHLSEAE